MTLATLQDLDRRPIAHLWNYACHPVSHPDPYGYSGHYISVVRETLRKTAERPHLPVLFFQGFSGNTRPSASVGIRTTKDLFRRIITGPSFQWQMLPEDYSRWTYSLADRVKAISAVTSPLRSTRAVTKRLTVPGREFAVGLSDPVTFQAVTFGEDLALLAVSAEVVAEYAEVARTLSPAPLTMCIGCIDNTYGYLPTRQMVSEGGYEADGFCVPFGIDRVLPSVEDAARTAFASLFTGMSRK